VPEAWRKVEKLAWMTETKDLNSVEWQTLAPDARNNWLTEGMHADFDAFPAAGNQRSQSRSGASRSKRSSRITGACVATSRDEWVYDWNREQLSSGRATLHRNLQHRSRTLADARQEQKHKRGRLRDL
jgi:predicted helicase